MGRVVGLAFVSALNPSLVAATTIMLLNARPQRLMFGYWFGSLLTSLTLGLVIVFVLEGSGFEHSAKKTVHPAITLTLAGLLLLGALVLASGRDERFEERRRRRKEDKKPPRWERWMQKGDPKVAFVIGVLLSFPGVTYLVALDRLGKPHYSTFATVLVVIGYCLVQLLLLEGAIIAFWVWPEEARPGRDRPRQGLGRGSLEDGRVLGAHGDRRGAGDYRDRRVALRCADSRSNGLTAPGSDETRQGREWPSPSHPIRGMTAASTGGRLVSVDW